VSDELIVARGVRKEYGNVVALENLDLVIRDGITGLLGENGAGKSTAIRIFLGLLQPTRGEVAVLGEDIARSVKARSLLGYMPEHDCLPTSVTAVEFLTHMAQVSGLPPSAARTRAADTLRHVGLFEERYRAIEGYSTGMKQRVKLAQALVHDPRMVLLDEPTAGLDPAGREEMLDLVRKTHREFGISIMLSSHLMGDVERTCDRLALVRGGTLIQEGAVTDFTLETERLSLEVDDREEELVDELARRGVAVERGERGGLVIEGRSDSVHDVVRDSLVAVEAPLRSMAPRRRALAELFARDGEDLGGDT